MLIYSVFVKRTNPRSQEFVMRDFRVSYGNTETVSFLSVLAFIMLHSRHKFLWHFKWEKVFKNAPN